MARVHDIQLREIPPGPNQYASKKDALAANPRTTVVDAVFGSKRSVEDAAFRVNGNKRADWPSDEYYAIWAFNPASKARVKSGENPKTAGRWELLIGLKECAPEEWLHVINAPGSRKRRRRSDDEVFENGMDETDGGESSFTKGLEEAYGEVEAA